MFPVEIDVEVLNCPPEWVCIEGDEATLVFNTLGWQGKNPLVYSYRCDDYSSTPVTLTLRTTMRDDDDVETTPIDHQITCNPPA